MTSIIFHSRPAGCATPAHDFAADVTTAALRAQFRLRGAIYRRLRDDLPMEWAGHYWGLACRVRLGCCH